MMMVVVVVVIMMIYWNFIGRPYRYVMLFNVRLLVDKLAKIWKLCCVIIFVTQSDLFSGGTVINHDNINKDGSLHSEF